MSFVGDLTWDEVGRRLLAGCDALLPIGAGAKEHGLHLPLRTDQIQAEWLSVKLAEATAALVWPTLTYGFYPAFRDYPGSVSLSAPLFEKLVGEVVGEIVRWRPRRLFVLDTGISTIKPVANALSAGTWEMPVVHLRIHEGPRYVAALERLRKQSFGSHADEPETSRMLVIAPHVVQMDRAEATPGEAFEGPLTRQRAPSGSYGDPTLATRQKGEALVEAMIGDLLETMGHMPRRSLDEKNVPDS